jgi:hypothetical protein
MYTFKIEMSLIKVFVFKVLKRQCGYAGPINITVRVHDSIVYSLCVVSMRVMMMLGFLK